MTRFKMHENIRGFVSQKIRKNLRGFGVSGAQTPGFRLFQAKMHDQDDNKSTKIRVFESTESANFGRSRTEFQRADFQRILRSFVS